MSTAVLARGRSGSGTARAVRTVRPTVQRIARPSVRPTVRLTRRGRLVLFLTVLAAVLAATVAVGPAVVATAGAGEPVDVRTVTVQPGQTLWEIAMANGGTGDPRTVVYEIEQLNHLDGAELQIGQTLDVPMD